MGLPPLLVGWPYGAGLDEFIPPAAVVWGPAVPALHHDGLFEVQALPGSMLESRTLEHSQNTSCSS